MLTALGPQITLVAWLSVALIQSATELMFLQIHSDKHLLLLNGNYMLTSDQLGNILQAMLTVEQTYTTPVNRTLPNPGLPEEAQT